MMFQDWCSSVNQLVSRLYEIDFGFPLGENKVAPPQLSRIVEEVFDHPSLRPFGVLWDYYAHCDGFSLPDVHVGYFIKPVSKLIVVDPESEPTEILGPFAGKVLVIGSTGGGGLFAIRSNVLDVLYLPPGPLHSGVYDGTQTSARVLASDFTSFLDTVKEDLRAFVEDTPKHRFIV